jgi:hypothetical protein
MVGRTPVIAKLARGDNHVVRLELPGYQPFETTFTKSVSGWVWGNILFGGLIGLAVDAISGGLYYLTPEQLQATLLLATPGDKIASSDSDEIILVVVLSPDPAWQRIDQLQTPQQ